MNLPTRALCLALALLAAPLAQAAERMVTEIFTVGFRPLAEVVPLLRPLVPPPGSVGGVGDQLVVRTSPDNMRDIRRILETINKAPANLMISVRSSIAGTTAANGLESFGTRSGGGVEISSGRPTGDTGLVIGTGDGAGVRIVRTRSADESRDVQRVRVLEGREAYIATGQSVPLADRRVVISGGGVATVNEGVRYRDVTSGFYVRPRLAGDQVTLEVNPHSERMSRSGGGAIDVAGASTVVSGRLGEWIEIGGVGETASRSTRGITSSTRTRSGNQYGVFLKVDRLD